MKLLFLLALMVVGSTVFAQIERIEALTKEGLARHDKGDYAGAIEKYQLVLRYDPNSDLMNYEIAFSYAQNKNYYKAIEHCDIVINGKGQSQMLAVVLKADCLDNLGKVKDADAFWKKSLKQFPQQYLLWLNYGIRSNKAGEPDVAEDAFLRALDLKADHPGSHLNMAYLKLKRGDKLKGILGLYFFLMLEHDTPRAEEALTILLANLDIPQSGKMKDSTRINVNITFPVSHAKLSRTDLGEVGLYLITTMNAELSKNKNQWEALSYNTDKIFLLLGELQAQGEKRVEDYWWGFYIPFFYHLNSAGYSEALSYQIATAAHDPLAEAWKKNHQEKLDAFGLWLKNL